MKNLIGILAATAIAVLSAVALAQTASTNTSTWAWGAPTTFTDGTAIPSTSSITYNLYVGSGGPGSESSTPVQTGVTALTVTTSGYTDGETVCGKITAVVNGIESAKSNEACKSFGTPNPPATLTVK